MAKTFVKLTRPNIRKLVASAKITEHGITFERLKNGDGVFSINVMADGQRIHRVVGRESDGTTRTQAEGFIEKVKQDAKHDRLALPKGRKVALSFRAAAEEYLERLDHEGGSDLRMKRVRLTQHLVPFFGDTPLSKISSFDVERYKHQRRSEKAARGGIRQRPKDESKLQDTSAATVNRELAVLSHLFTKAMQWGWVDRPPAKINRYREQNARITYLTVEQVKRLVECAKADTNTQIYPFIVIGLETSMRRMEILSIRREQVDLQRRVIFIPKAKAGAREQPITAHLTEFLASYLAALPKGTPWLFPSLSAKDGHTVEIRKPFRRVVAAAGLDPDVVVRHTIQVPK